MFPQEGLSGPGEEQAPLWLAPVTAGTKQQATCPALLRRFRFLLDAAGEPMGQAVRPPEPVPLQNWESNKNPVSPPVLG